MKKQRIRENTHKHEQQDGDCQGEGLGGGGGGGGEISGDGWRRLGVVNTRYSVQVMHCRIFAPKTCITLLTSVISINPIKIKQK